METNPCCSVIRCLETSGSCIVIRFLPMQKSILNEESPGDVDIEEGIEVKAYENPETKYKFTNRMDQYLDVESTNTGETGINIPDTVSLIPEAQSHTNEPHPETQLGMHPVCRVSQVETNVTDPAHEVQERSSQDALPQQQASSQHEQLKAALNFSYWVVGLSFIIIITIFSRFLGNKGGHGHKLLVWTCTFFAMATMLTGVGLMLLGFRNTLNNVLMIVLKVIKYIALGLLTLTMFNVYVLLL